DPVIAGQALRRPAHVDEAAGALLEVDRAGVPRRPEPAVKYDWHTAASLGIVDDDIVTGIGAVEGATAILLEIVICGCGYAIVDQQVNRVGASVSRAVALQAAERARHMLAIDEPRE